jgi:hypothetical protein
LRGHDARHGFDLALDPRHRELDWSSVEPQAGQNRDESTMGLWGQYRHAVHYGWEQGLQINSE